MGSRLFLAALAVLALSSSPAYSFWWRYGSMAEADAACEKWASRGGTFRYKWERKTEIDFTTPDGWERKIEKRISTESVRHCLHEEETNQFLGYEYPTGKIP
jgi:hypothetical protein